MTIRQNVQAQDMDACKHLRIQSWFTAEGEPVPLWSCAACQVKFEPLVLSAAPAGEPPASPQGEAVAVESDNDKVICPNCCHQFRAIPVNVQAEMRALAAAPRAPAPDAASVDEPLCHKSDTPERVCFYEQEFYPLSNFSAFRLHWQGREFDTSEAAYQCEKFTARRDIGMLIYNAKSAHEAFKIAESNKGHRRKDWNAVKVDIMRSILRAKVDQHEYVRRKLLETGGRELVEDSWRDAFWGWGPNRDGQNMLGRLWMEVRAELRTAAPAPDDCDPTGVERAARKEAEAAAAAPAGEPPPLKTWQHDETGRICRLERSPGPRWTEVPSESPAAAAPTGEPTFTFDALKAAIQADRDYERQWQAIAAPNIDAQRYRWLRDESNDCEWPDGGDWTLLGEAEGAEFDAIVDAAMRAAPAGEPVER